MADKKRVRVGVFDSGVGGLTVLDACVRRLPQAEYFYFGDNDNAPYGNRSAEEITGFVFDAMRGFVRLGVDCVVLACNTVTAVCAEALRGAFPFPIVGMEPAVRPAGNFCRKALVLATARTAESKRLRDLIGKESGCAFTVRAVPRLAGAIEGALVRSESFRLSEHLPRGEFDGVVLGCTHYVYFKKEIGEFYGAKVFDGNEGAANRLFFLLKDRISGTDDHLATTSNPNVCFNSNLQQMGQKRVFFLGNGAKINENIYKTNVCFKNN